MTTKRGTAPFPRKRFGQNFLEPAWVAKVIRAIDPQPSDFFIEIGPGRGALTRPLAARARAVVAYEIDRDLAAELQATAPPNVGVLQGDFLTAIVGFGQLSDAVEDDPGFPLRLRVAGNLPYNVASPILFKLVELFAISSRCVPESPLADATVMLQREVADRLVAKPGTKEYGVLSVLIRHSADVERLLALPPGAFRPAPKVHSSLVRLKFHAPDPPVRDAAVFTALVQAVFTRRRKTLANALLASRAGTGPAHVTERGLSPLSGTDPRPERGLSPLRALANAGIDGSRRPETLTVAEFARLADVYSVRTR